MKIATGISSVIIFLIIGCSRNCVYNIEANKAWKKNFNVSHLNILIEEPKVYCHKKDSNLNCVELVINYNLYLLKEESSIFTLRHENYQNACQAYNHFNDDFKYWSSKWPKYEKRYGPVFELLQDSSIYILSGNYEKTDSIGELLFLELKKSLGLIDPERNSVFTRKSYYRAEME